MNAQLHFLPPAYAPGLHNASVDELIRMADAEPNPSPLLRALADTLADQGDHEKALDAAREEWDAEKAQLDNELSTACEARDAHQEAADAFRFSLREALHHLAGHTDPEAIAEFIEEVRALFAAFPSEAEKAAAERARIAAEQAAIAEMEARAPGFAARNRKEAKIEYLAPRGRKWRTVGCTYRATPRWAAEVIAKIPQGSTIRCVGG